MKLFFLCVAKVYTIIMEYEIAKALTVLTVVATMKKHKIRTVPCDNREVENTYGCFCSCTGKNKCLSGKTGYFYSMFLLIGV